MKRQIKPVNKAQKPYIANWKKLFPIYLALAAFFYATYYFILPKQKSITNPIDKKITKTSPVSSTGWKTYTDQNLNYSVKYPENWNLESGQFKTTNNKPSWYIDIKSPDYTTRVGMGLEDLASGTEIHFSIEKTNEASIDEWFANFKPAGGIHNKSTTSVAGQKAYQYESAYEGPEGRGTVFIKDKTLFLISMPYLDEKTKKEYLPVYDGILSNFTFNESESSAIIPGWETFLDQGYGFTFKYPAGWVWNWINKEQAAHPTPDYKKTIGFKNQLSGTEKNLEDFDFGYIITKQSLNELISDIKKHHPEAEQINIALRSSRAVKLIYGANKKDVAVIIDPVSKRFNPSERLMIAGNDEKQVVTKVVSSFIPLDDRGLN